MLLTNASIYLDSIFFRAQLLARCFAFLLRSNKDMHTVFVSQSIGIFALLLCFLTLIMLGIKSMISCYSTELHSQPSMNDKLLPHFIIHIFSDEDAEAVKYKAVCQEPLAPDVTG